MSEKEPNIENDVIEALMDTWERFPRLRLGQLLMNVIKPDNSCPEIFNIEDSQLIKKLRRFTGIYGDENPQFTEGDKVEVILNERNKTHRTGDIHKIIWHHKDKKHNYYITSDGKKISKRYFDEDLKIIE